MEIQIFNSILFRELMPWTFNKSNINSINEILKNKSKKESLNYNNVHDEVKSLVAIFPTLLKWLESQKIIQDETLASIIFQGNELEYSDNISKFYFLLITKEQQRLFNWFSINIKKWSNPIDINYHTQTALNNIKALIKNIFKKIEERGFEEMPNEGITLDNFVLYTLYVKSIELFFSIQELQKGNLSSTISIEDFFLTELNLPKSKMIHFTKTKLSEKEYYKPPHKSSKLTFGFRGNVEQFNKVVKILVIQLDFINESKTSIDQFIEVFTAKDLKPIKTEIHIGCQTTIFQFIMEQMIIFARNFNPSTIQKSKLFYTNDGTPIEANLLYVTKNKAKISSEKIDQIKSIFNSN